MANAWRQGGGWLEGATAQEEQLCYRSTLIRTLALAYYKLPMISCIFSPKVAIFRGSSSEGYRLYSDLTPPRNPEVLSVLSVAAEYRPHVNSAGTDYLEPHDREIMKSKIRLLLRTAAREGIRRLVLGALGCGAFRNPSRAVARCFREVFAEREFQGWWEEVIFAVLEDGANNLAVFSEELQGMLVNEAVLPAKKKDECAFATLGKEFDAWGSTS